MQETQETPVHSLSQKDLLEKGMATHSSILTWRIPWGCKESDTTERLPLSFLPLQPPISPLLVITEYRIELL